MSKVYLFSSPTCGPCKQLKKDLNVLGIKEYIERDISKPETDKYLRLYNIRAVPTLVLAAEDETPKDIQVGYSGNKDELKRFFL